MARRVIAIPLAVTIAIAVFSVSVLCTSPDNSIDSSYNVSCSAVFGNTSDIDSAVFPVGSYNFGQSIMEKSYVLHYNATASRYATIIDMSTSFDIDVGKISSLYIMVRTGAFSSGNIDYTSLSSYYYPSGNLTDTLTIQCQSVDYLVDSSGSFLNKNVKSTFSENFNVTFLCFRNVPIGSYTIVDSSVGGTETSGNYTYTYSWLTFGVYGDGIIIDPESIVNDYVSGDTSFSDAITNITQAVADNVNASSDPCESLLAYLQGQYSLDLLVINSNDKSIINIYQAINPAFDSQISRYVSGSSSLDDTIASMSSTYTEALSAAETPEQGTFINTTYQIKMQQLEFEARQKSNAKMDSAITDEDLQKADDYYQLEDDIFSLFDLQELKDNLVFDQWYQSMSLTEAVSYKSIFDWFLNDSEVRYWLIVPISFIVIAILLSTTYRVTGKWDD